MLAGERFFRDGNLHELFGAQRFGGTEKGSAHLKGKKRYGAVKGVIVPCFGPELYPSTKNIGDNETPLQAMRSEGYGGFTLAKRLNFPLSSFGSLRIAVAMVLGFLCNKPRRKGQIGSLAPQINPRWGGRFGFANGGHTTLAQNRKGG